MALHVRIQTQIVADQPERFGMVANGLWARRDYGLDKPLPHRGTLMPRGDAGAADAR